MKERDNLETALREYLFQLNSLDDPDQFERLFSGVLAFIWINVQDYPFQPFFGSLMEQSEPRKWWQFWRKL
jgi:hypothetical protein